MSELHRHRIRFSDGQKRKLRLAFRKRRPVVIGLTKNDIGSSQGGDDILLTERQHKAVTRALKNGTGLRLALGHDQLVKNKEGGLLNEMLHFVEEKVPGVKRFVSPLLRGRVAPLLKNNFLPWLKRLIENELDTVIENKGAGLKRRIGRKLDALMSSAAASESGCRSQSLKKH